MPVTLPELRDAGGVNRSKPEWVDSVESLLLANIAVFALVTWFVGVLVLIATE